MTTTMKALVAVMLLGSAVSLAPTAASAQPDPERSRGEEACGSDARRWCRKVLDQGDMAVLSCLQSHEKKLKKTCRKMLQDNGQL